MFKLKTKKIIENLKNGKLFPDEKAEPYDLFAKCYDDVMKEVDYRNWTDYLLDLASLFDIKPKSILDIGCGTGWMVYNLLLKGYKADGLDISKSMLKIATERINSKAMKTGLYCQDMETFRLPEKYDLIFSFNDSINYLKSYQNLINCFSNIYNHLNKNSAFIFDVATEYHLIKNFVLKDFTRKYKDFTFLWENSYDKITKTALAIIYFIYPDGRIDQELHIQKIYSIEEIRSALKNSGFGNIKVFSAFSMKPPKYNSFGYHFIGFKY